MTPAALLADLRRRGVLLSPVGEQLRYRARRGALTPDLAGAVKAHRAALLELLRQEPLEPDHDLGAAPIIESRERLGAVRIRSERFGEVWVAVDSCIAPELAAEEATHAVPRPVLLVEDVLRLRGKPPDVIRAALEVIAAFPSARVVQ